MINKTAVRDIDPTEIEKFKKSLSNEFITLMPNDEGYEEALLRWADNSIMKAGLIIKASTLEDIVATINFARKHGCDFAVRGGGFSPYSSSNGGIVLDMRKRNKVRVDTEKKLVHVQAGAIWKDVYNETWKYGLAVSGAIVDSIGVGGMTLAGGFGFLTPKHGMVIDNLVGATIVLADGSVKQLSNENNQDLFWAIRGGGPNFGAITDFIFKAHDQPNKVIAGYLIYPTEKLQGIIEATNNWLNNRQSDEDVLLTICRIPPDFNTHIVILLFLNDPSHEKFRARFSDYYKLDPISDSTSSLTFPEANSLSEGAFFGGRKAVGSGHVCAPLKFSTFQSVLNAYLDFIKEHPNGGGYGAVLFEFHTNINIPSNATAYPHRKKIYHVAIGQRWQNENDDEDGLKWVKHVANLINQDYNLFNTVSLNFHAPNLIMKKGDVILDDVDPKEVYGDNLERLKEIKAKYDPTVFFDKNVVIRP